MSTTKAKQNQNTDQTSAEVLYQRLGAKWYAFAEVDGEMYMSAVDEAITDDGDPDTWHEGSEEFYHGAISGAQARGGRNTPSAA